MPELRTYHGQCHCGAVRYTATTDLGGLMDCNCSRCRRLGWVMQPVPAEDFELVSGADSLVDYRFNTGAIQHLFCRDCGIESFARGQDRQGRAVVMINVNALEDAPAIDHSTVLHWNGAGA